eukprot:3920922-Rhodomonas_salina.2
MVEGCMKISRHATPGVITSPRLRHTPHAWFRVQATCSVPRRSKHTRAQYGASRATRVGWYKAHVRSVPRAQADSTGCRGIPAFERP